MYNLSVFECIVDVHTLGFGWVLFQNQFFKISKISAQIREFLNSLLVGSALLPAVLEKMENLYKLSDSCNVEILFSWIRVGIAAWNIQQ